MKRILSVVILVGLLLTCLPTAFAISFEPTNEVIYPSGISLLMTDMNEGIPLGQTQVKHSVDYNTETVSTVRFVGGSGNTDSVSNKALNLRLSANTSVVWDGSPMMSSGVMTVTLSYDNVSNGSVGLLFGTTGSTTGKQGIAIRMDNSSWVIQRPDGSDPWKTFTTNRVLLNQEHVIQLAYHGNKLILAIDGEESEVIDISNFVNLKEALGQFGLFKRYTSCNVKVKNITFEGVGYFSTGKGALAIEIAEIESLPINFYTNTSWIMMEKELEKAKAVYENPIATEEEVEMAVEQLKEKKGTLILETDASNILKNRLVLHSTFNSTDIVDTKIKDVSGNENHGTNVGEATFVEDSIIGKAVSFDNGENTGKDGTKGTQYIDYGLSSQLNNADMTGGNYSLSLWVKSKEGGSDNSAIFSNKAYASGSNIGFAVGNFNNGQKDVRYNFKTGNESRKDINGLKANDDNWHHLVLSVNRNGYLIGYMDGVEVGRQNISGDRLGTADAGLDLVLGAAGSKTNALSDFTIDELRIYNNAIEKDMAELIFKTEGYKVAIDQLELKVNSINISPDFPKNMVDNMKKDIVDTKKLLENENNIDNILISLNKLYDRFEDFMAGSTPVTSFFATADAHLEKNTQSLRNLGLISALKDMKNLNPDPNTGGFIALGDNTEYGTLDETKILYKIMKENNPFSNERTNLIMGNHEARGTGSWGSSPDEELPYWNTAYQLYMEYNAPYMPDTGGKTYFDKWIDGYHYISLNTEKALKDRIFISQEQLSWLEDLLEKDKENNKPTFIFAHQSLDETHWRANVGNGFGSQKDDLKEILKKYPDVIMLSGHIHNGLGVVEAIEREYGTFIEVPSFSKSENGIREIGVGFYVKIYEDAVVFRARNFATSTWLHQYDIVVNLESLPTIYKEAKSLDETKYTAESWVEVASSMAEAEVFFKKEYPLAGDYETGSPKEKLFGAESRKQIDITRNNLRVGLDSLTLLDTVDKAALTKKLEEIDKLDKLDYTSASWDILMVAATEARLVLENPSATQIEIDDAQALLQTSFDGLELVSLGDLDISLLDFMIKEADKLTEDGALEGVVESVVKKFNEALKEAKVVLAKAESTPESVTQEEVDTATNNLINMIHLLEFKGNKTKLKNLITFATPYEAEKETYRPATYEVFEKAIKDARDVLADDTALQDEIDDAWEALADALADLRKIPNKDLLRKAIAKGNAINSALYTAESYAVLGTRLSEGDKVMKTDDDNLLKEDVDTATKGINEAIDGLVLIPVADTTTAPSSTPTTKADDTTTAATTKANAKSAPKTGEANIVLIITLVATLSLAVAVGIKKSKKIK